MSDDFFAERSEESAVKARLVEKYFRAWAGIMQSSAQRYSRDKRLAYFDLFCGPGRYDDGSISVPLAVLKKAIMNPYLKENLVTFFNDRNRDAVSKLQQEIDKLQGIRDLKFPPEISCSEIDENFKQTIEQMNLVPSFSFLDPWGYKGLSIGLIEAFIKDWGCDCFFFFNYNRINMGMTNERIENHINSLFGESRADAIRENIKDITPDKRNLIILDNIISALEEKAGNQKRFVLPFCFRNDNQRITHYLIFVSKHFRGYDTMKKIMHCESTTRDQGVANFEYCRADETAPRLFEMTRPLDKLKERLLEGYSGQTISLKDLYEQNSYRTPYILNNYKDICLQLEQENRITVQRPSPRSPKNSIADKSIITFLEQQ